MIVHLTSLALAAGAVLPGCTLESESGSLRLASECARAYLVATASAVAVVIVGVPARAVTLLLARATAAVRLADTVDAVRSRLALCVSSLNLPAPRRPSSRLASTHLLEAGPTVLVVVLDVVASAPAALLEARGARDALAVDALLVLVTLVLPRLRGSPGALTKMLHPPHE
jgi:hypothetical protein